MAGSLNDEINSDDESDDGGLSETSDEKVLNKNKVNRTATQRTETSKWPPAQST